jgi:hypothetical protein
LYGSWEDNFQLIFR